MPETAETAPKESRTEVELVCWKVWGGNGRVQTPIRIPGLHGSLYSKPFESDRGGDLYYFSACGSGALARLCVADVSGHGPAVAQYSAWLEEIFSRHIHRANPARVLREVNRRSVTRGMTLMSTAVCISYNSLNGSMAYCSAGHPPLRVCKRGSCRWEPLHVSEDSSESLYNLPLAVDEAVQFSMGNVALEPGDRVLIYTDGLTELADRDGAQLGQTLWEEGRIPGSDQDLDAVVGAIQAAVQRHRSDDTETQDDITFVVLEALPYQRHNRYTLLLRNNFQRFTKSLRRALRRP